MDDVGEELRAIAGEDKRDHAITFTLTDTNVVPTAAEGTSMTSSLHKLRQEAAEAAFSNHDFTDAQVSEISGWEYEQPGFEYTRTVFYVNPDNPGGDTLKGHFTVVFESATSAKVRDAYAMIDGNLIGQLDTLPVICVVASRSQALIAAKHERVLNLAPRCLPSAERNVRASDGGACRGVEELDSNLRRPALRLCVGAR